MRVIFQTDPLPLPRGLLDSPGNCGASLGCLARRGEPSRRANTDSTLTISETEPRQWLALHLRPVELPGNPIVDLEVAFLDVKVQPVLAAVQVEIADPSGSGFRILMDLPLTLDLAIRLVGSAMRLRKLIP